MYYVCIQYKWLQSDICVFFYVYHVFVYPLTICKPVCFSMLGIVSFGCFLRMGFLASFRFVFFSHHVCFCPTWRQCLRSRASLGRPGRLCRCTGRVPLFLEKKDIFESWKLTFPTSLSFFARSDGGINSCNVPPFPIDKLSTVMKIEQARELHINLNSCWSIRAQQY